MKLILVFFVTLSMFFSCSKEKEENEVVVYAYDSFTGEWGAGAKIAEMYEYKYGTKVRFVPCKDAGAMLFSAIKEKESPIADVILGIDNNIAKKALSAEILSPYKPKGSEKIGREFVMDDEGHLTAFDYGYFAFMYNTESGLEAPRSLEDLMGEGYKNKIVLMNPSTSTPGLGALMWVHKVYGDSYLEAWGRLAANAISMPTSWSQGYAMFTAGEVPIAISYTTSLAAHVLYDNTSKFQPLIFEEGHLLQLEGMALLKGARHEEAAKNFMDFMLSKDVQALLCETQFMFPIIEDVELPKSFQDIPQPNKILREDVVDVSGIIEDAMNILN